MKTNRIGLWAAMIAGICMIGMAMACGKGSTAKAPAPAKVDHPVMESELTTLSLTAKAVERLGLVLKKVEYLSIHRTLHLGGEIIAVPGRSAMVCAPVAGTVLSPGAAAFPQPGTRFKQGQAVLRLILLAPDKDFIGARQEVEVKQKYLEIVQAKAKRATQLFADHAESEKTMQETQAELVAAEAALNTAKARLRLFESNGQDSAAASLPNLMLASPVDGILSKIVVTPGQVVPAGAPLFELVGQDPVWVRVPVYVGDLASIDPKQPARVEVLGGPPGTASYPARPVPGPPLSDPETASADLFFEMANPGAGLRIGQKVDVTLSYRDNEPRLAVPASAILYDAQGGAWIYTCPRAGVFIRRRVAIAHIADGLAILARGPVEGTDVVVTGAAELFGTEFGAGK